MVFGVAWSFEKGDNIVLAGSAGTGKTFVALFLALEEVLDREQGGYPQVRLPNCKT